MGASFYAVVENEMRCSLKEETPTRFCEECSVNWTFWEVETLLEKQKVGAKSSGPHTTKVCYSTKVRYVGFAVFGAASLPEIMVMPHGLRCKARKIADSFLSWYAKQVMTYSFVSFEEKLREVEEWLRRELAQLRSGVASPAILDGVQAEAYGTPMPLTQVASVTIEDAKTLRVAPWDQGNVRAIEKAIGNADLGVSCATDEQGVRVIFPPLTSESRAKLVKLVGAKLEEARVRLRHERDRVWSELQAKEKAGEFGEDDKFRAKETMEKKVKETNERLQQLAKTKEEELRGA